MGLCAAWEKIVQGLISGSRIYPALLTIQSHTRLEHVQIGAHKVRMARQGRLLWGHVTSPIMALRSGKLNLAEELLFTVKYRLRSSLFLQLQFHR